MSFKLSIVHETDINFERAFIFFSDTFKELAKFMASEENRYGVEHISIKVISINLGEGFEDFFPPRKPRFKRNFIAKNPLYGDKEYKGYFEYDLKISATSYSKLLEANREESLEIIHNEILHSYKDLSLLSKRVKEFDLDDFNNDVSSFFESAGSNLHGQPQVSRSQ